MNCTEPDCKNTAHVRYSWPWQKGGEEACCQEHLNAVQVRAQQLQLTVPLQFLPIGVPEIEAFRAENLQLREQLAEMTASRDTLQTQMNLAAGQIANLHAEIDHLRTANAELTAAAARASIVNRTDTIPPEADEDDVPPGQIPSVVEGQ